MQLTPENYYSREANMAYLSVSQYKAFLQCEAAAMAELTGEYEREEKEAFLVGNYLHAWNEGKLNEFVVAHPEIVSTRGATKGELKTPFKIADQMIATLEEDPKAMFYLRGLKEVPIVGEIAGVPWKAKVDVLNNELSYMTDLKSAANITEFRYDPKAGARVSFIEQWGYMIQAAVYSELERVSAGREDYKDFYIVAVTKQDPPDHELIDLTDPERIRAELEQITANVPHIVAVKAGKEAPARCGICPYCRATKKVGKPVHYTELKEIY